MWYHRPNIRAVIPRPCGEPNVIRTCIYNALPDACRGKMRERRRERFVEGTRERGGVGLRWQRIGTDGLADRSRFPGPIRWAKAKKQMACLRRRPGFVIFERSWASVRYPIPYPERRSGRTESVIVRRRAKTNLMLTKA